MTKTIFIEEIAEGERKLMAGECVVTLQTTMPDDYIGKIIRRKLSHSNGASVSVRMVDGDPDQQ